MKKPCVILLEPEQEPKIINVSDSHPRTIIEEKIGGTDSMFMGKHRSMLLFMNDFASVDRSLPANREIKEVGLVGGNLIIAGIDYHQKPPDLRGLSFVGISLSVYFSYFSLL